MGKLTTCHQILEQGGRVKTDKRKQSGNFRDGVKAQNGVEESVWIGAVMGTCCLRLHFKMLSVSQRSTNGQIQAIFSKLNLFLSRFVHLLN